MQDATIMDETFDFIVVGSGGGSMCAALVMRSLGKSVLILEKTDLFGGTTAMSGGVMWIPNNPFMKPAGVEDSADKAMRYLDHVVGDHDDTPGASRERRTAYVTEAPRMVDFLLEQGIRLLRTPYWPDYYDERPGASEPGRTVVAELFDASVLGEWRTKLRPNYLQLPATLEEAVSLPHLKQTWKAKRSLLTIVMRGITAKLTGKHWVAAGNALQGRMLHAALKAGVDLRANAAVKRLETADDGRVSGVLAEIDGRKRRFAARDGVLVNAGGFSRNQAMRDRYQPGTSVAWTNASPGDTGEMIQEMMRLGADVAQMEEMVGCQVTLTPENPDLHAMVQGDVSAPHSIIVDQSGVRYMREAQSYMLWCQQVFERDKTVPAIPSWLVLDSQYMRKYMLSGSLPFGRKKASWFESGFLKKANTLTELAAMCGMQPGTLEASIERFNGFARAGKDEDFHRGDRAYDRYLGDSTHGPSPSLGTIEKGPFYAVQVYPGDVGTYGGVVTDVDARVLRADGSPIPGLYATGISTASVMGRAYPGAGSSVGPSFVWGYVAAKHAAHAGNQVA